MRMHLGGKPALCAATCRLRRPAASIDLADQSPDLFQPRLRQLLLANRWRLGLGVGHLATAACLPHRLVAFDLRGPLHGCWPGALSWARRCSSPGPAITCFSAPMPNPGWR